MGLFAVPCSHTKSTVGTARLAGWAERGMAIEKESAVEPTSAARAARG